jgi:hypothetical protein
MVKIRAYTKRYVALRNGTFLTMKEYAASYGIPYTTCLSRWLLNFGNKDKLTEAQARLLHGEKK